MSRNGACLVIVAVAACFLQAGTVVHAACPYDLAGAQQRELRARISLEDGKAKYKEAQENLRRGVAPKCDRILTRDLSGRLRWVCTESPRVIAKNRVKSTRRNIGILKGRHDKAKAHLVNIERFAKTHRDCKPRKIEASTPPAAVRSGENISGAASVVDGDTIIVQGRRFELFGIDAPEIKQTCRNAGMTWPCGEEAADYLRNLLIDDLVTCDQRSRDRLGRIVSVCRIQDQDINASLVRQGWALANRDVSTDYVAVEEAAKDAGGGIWTSQFIPPSEWRRGKR